MIVQEKNQTLEFKLPSYDEFLKGNQNQDAFLVMDDAI